MPRCFVVLIALSICLGPPAAVLGTEPVPDPPSERPALNPEYLLEILAAQTPEGLWFREIGWAQTDLAIEGFALDNEQIATFMSDLDRTPYMTDVYLIRIESVPHPGGVGKAKKFRITGVTAEPSPAETTWTEWPSGQPPGARDVFQPVIARSGSETPAGEAKTAWEYPAERYSLVGIVTNLSEPSAMLLGPDGLGHVVRVGDAYGTDRAVVEAIDAQGIRVRRGDEQWNLTLPDPG